MRIPGSLVLVAITIGAQGAHAADQTFLHSCETARSAAISLLQQREFKLAPAPSCLLCVDAQTKHLEDAEGHRFFSNRKVIEQYTTKSLNHEKSGPVVQKLHVGLTVQAHLRLLPTSDTCQVDLRFAYSWYGAEMILGFPVDGDPGHGDSNGKLEAAYLQALQQRLARLTVAQR